MTYMIVLISAPFYFFYTPSCGSRRTHQNALHPASADDQYGNVRLVGDELKAAIDDYVEAVQEDLPATVLPSLARQAAL